MPDPTTHAGIVAAATPTVAVTATLTGIMLWPFGLACIAGAVALIYLERMEPKNALFSVIGSCLIGGSLSQIGVYLGLLVLPNFFPSFSPWASNQDARLALIFLLAIVIGLVCQKAIPAALRRTDRVIGGSS